MADNLVYPVAYLEVQDFDGAGNLTAPKLKNKPVMVMMQAGWCGHCNSAKPEFQKLSKMGVVECATIQADGEKESEKALGKGVEKIYPGDFQGFPSYMLILPGGKKIEYNGGRSAEDIKQFVSSQVGNYQ